MKQRSYLVFIKDNKVLLVRETEATGFKLPGGRLELNETPLQGLQREIKEELGSEINSSTVHLISDYIYQHSDYGDWKTYIFKGDLSKSPQADGVEIAELSWFSLDSPTPLRPHMESHVIPLLRNGGYLK